MRRIVVAVAWVVGVVSTIGCPGALPPVDDDGCELHG